MDDRRQSEKKDRILNARIPEELDRELRERAKRLDVPVSQLVRQLLQRTVDLVGNVTGNVEHLVTEIAEDVAQIRDVAHGAASTPKARARAELIGQAVVGWQEIRANRPERCIVTSALLRRGDRAHLGIGQDGRPVGVVSDAALELILRQQDAALPWVSIKLSRPVACARTGRQMQQGETAWFQPGASTVEFVSDEAYREAHPVEADEKPDASEAAAIGEGRPSGDEPGEQAAGTGAEAGAAGKEES